MAGALTALAGSTIFFLGVTVFELLGKPGGLAVRTSATVFSEVTVGAFVTGSSVFIAGDAGFAVGVSTGLASGSGTDTGTGLLSATGAGSGRRETEAVDGIAAIESAVRLVWVATGGSVNGAVDASSTGS